GRRLQGSDSLSRVRDFRDANAIVSVDDHHFTACNQLVSQQQIGGFLNLSVELDDRTGGQIQNFPQRQDSLSKPQREIEINSEQKVKIRLMANVGTGFR